MAKEGRSGDVIVLGGGLESSLKSRVGKGWEDSLGRKDVASVIGGGIARSVEPSIRRDGGRSSRGSLGGIIRGRFGAAS